MNFSHKLPRIGQWPGFCSRIFIVALLTFAQLSVSAADEVYENPVEGNALSIGMTHSVADVRYPQMVNNFGWTSQWKNEAVLDRLEIGIADALNTVGQADFRLGFRFSITAWDFSGAAVAVTSSPVQLDLEYDNLTNTARLDKAIYRFEGYHNFEFELVEVVDLNSGLPVSSLPTNVYINPRIEVERYYHFDPTQVPGQQNSLTHIPNPNNANELLVSWGHIDGAEEYQLEWTFINNYNGSIVQNTQNYDKLLPGNIPFDLAEFRRNSTRISTTEQSYSIPLIYEQGWILYRLRAKGWRGTPEIRFVEGKWSTQTGNTFATVADFSEKYEWEGQDKALNWNYKLLLSEEGKRKEVIDFFDGSMRKRQAVTRINSNGEVVVGNSIYDYEGRAAVEVLPAPVSSNTLGYYGGLDRNGAGEVYSRSDFDEDDLNGNCNASLAAPLADVSGAGKYYSTNNPVQNNHQDFVPDGEGYPMRTIEYQPDPTGRIRRSGAAGPVHQLNSGRETQYFYGKARQEELDRLFGLNVGFSKHYKKNMVIDPNGQVSVVYLGPGGNVVATSLAGTPPAMLETLEHRTTSTLDIDLLNKVDTDDPDTQVDDNLRYSTGAFPNGFEDELRVSSEEHVTTDGSFYTLNYEAEPGEYSEECLDVVCYPYVFDLDVSMQNKCGDEMLYFVDPIGQTPQPGDFGPISTRIGTLNSASCGNPGSFADVRYGTLNIGTYSLSKSIRVSHEAAEHFAESYLTDAAACLLTEEDFLEDEISRIDFDACNMECDDCLKDVFEGVGGDPSLISVETSLNQWNSLLPGLNTTVYTAQEWETAYTNCTQACVDPSPCSILKSIFLADVSPGGQYGSTDPTDLTSIYFPLQLGIPTWKAPQLNGQAVNYLNEDGTLAYVQVELQSDGSYVPAVTATPNLVSGSIYKVKPGDLANFSDFINAFELSWAEALVGYHPEYCYYETCVKQEEENSHPSGDDLSAIQFEDRLRAIDDIFDAGQRGTVGMGVVNDQTWTEIIDLDPYFTISGAVAQSPTDYTCGFSTFGWTPNQTFQYNLGNYDDTNILTDYLNSYVDNGTGTYWNIWQFAKFKTRCSTYFGTGCNGANLPFNSFSAGEQNQIWAEFRELYLLARQHVQQKMAHAISIDGGCYNGVIGSSGLLANKTKRIVDIDDVRDSLDVNGPGPYDELLDQVEQTGFAYYQETGNCPLIQDLELFLNGINTDNHLYATGNPSLVGLTALTPGLYTQLSGVAIQDFGLNPYLELDLSVNSGSSGLDLAVEESGSSVPGCGSLSFTSNQLNLLSGATWTNFGSTWKVASFSQLVYQSGSGANTNFSVLVKAYAVSDPNVLVEMVWNGTTCLPLGDCNFDICSGPSAQSEELVTLLNALSLDNFLTSTSAIPLHVDYAVQYENTHLEAAIGGQAWYQRMGALTGRIASVPNPGAGDPIYTIAFSEPLVNLDGANLALEGVEQGVFTQLNLESDPGTGSLSALAFNIRVNDENGDPLDFCCGSADVPGQILFEVLERKVNANVGSVSWSNLAGSLQASLQDAGFSAGTAVAVNFGTCSTSGGLSSFVLSQAGGASCCVILRDANGDIVDPSTLDHVYDFQAQPQLGPGRFDLQVVIGGVVMVLAGETDCIDFVPVPEDCDICIPTPWQPVSCQQSWSNLLSALSGASLPSPDLTGLPVGGGADPNEEEFCELNYKYFVDDYLDYLGILNVTSTNDPNWIKIDDFALLNAQGGASAYADFVQAVNNSSLSSGDQATLLNSIGLNSFVTNGYRHCYAAYMAYLATQSGLTVLLDDFCQDYEGEIDNGCTPFPLPFGLNLTYVDPCEEDLMRLAEQNAAQAYLTYIQGIHDGFVLRYAQGAMDNLVERFTMEKPDDEFHHTLFYYNQAGELVRTIPPNGTDTEFKSNHGQSLAFRDGLKAARLAEETPFSEPQYVPNHRYASTYMFNTLGQLRKQKTVDGGESRYYYDALGRMVLSQNAKQASEYNPARFSYLLYDDLGRVKESGEIEGLAVFSGLSAQDLEAELIAITEDKVNFNQPGNRLYDWVNDGTLSKYVVTRTHFDKLFLSLPSITLEERGEIRGRITAISYDSHVEPGEGYLNYERASHFSYDMHGFINTKVDEDRSLAQINKQYFRVDYAHDLLSGNVNEIAVQKGEEDAFFYRYAYDADNRLLSTETSQDGINWARDAKMFYFDHGPLARIETGDKYVQGTDIVRTIQGWLTAHNGNALNPLTEVGQDGMISVINPNRYVAQDAAGFSLSRFNGDYNGRQAGSNRFLNDVEKVTSLTSFHELFNGNIANMSTALRDISEDPIALASNNYRYDQLQRFKGMESHLSDLGSEYTYQQAAQSAASDFYSTNVAYDANGNILGLGRNDQNGAGMDELSYFYFAEDGTIYPGVNVDDPNPVPLGATNRLAYVDDDFNTVYNNDLEDQAPGNYRYDAIGQLIGDASEEIASIEWLANNRVSKVIRTPNSSLPDLEFEYGALGHRTVKIVKPKDGNGNVINADQWTYTYYQRDAGGTVLSTYERSYGAGPGGSLSESYRPTEHHLFGYGRLGIESSYEATGNLNGVMYFFPLATGQTTPYVSNGAVDYDRLDAPSQFTATVFDPATLHYLVGMRQYECKNHLGNVLATVSDKKLLRLEEQVALGEDFEANVVFTQIPPSLNYPPVYPWYYDNATPNLVPQSGSQVLEVSSTVQFGAVNKVFNTIPGETYALTLELGQGTATNVQLQVYAQLNPGSTSLYSGALSAGTNNVVFTATTDQCRIKVMRGDAGSANLTFALDDVQVKLGGGGLLTYLPDVQSFSDYYPFGMQMPGRNGSVSGYRFGFQGQEKDDEIKGAGNSINYKYRMHNPRLGRFFAVDPLMAKYPHNSPYAFSENRLINAVELEGLEAKDTDEWEPGFERNTSSPVVVDEETGEYSVNGERVSRRYDDVYHYEDGSIAYDPNSMGIVTLGTVEVFSRTEAEVIQDEVDKIWDEVKYWQNYEFMFEIFPKIEVGAKAGVNLGPYNLGVQAVMSQKKGEEAVFDPNWLTQEGVINKDFFVPSANAEAKVYAKFYLYEEEESASTIGVSIPIVGWAGIDLTFDPARIQWDDPMWLLREAQSPGSQTITSFSIFAGKSTDGPMKVGIPDVSFSTGGAINPISNSNGK